MNDSVKVTNAEMVQYVTNAIDTWAETLGEILTMLDEVVDSTNGEFVANNLVEKINYIEETKGLIRKAILDKGIDLPSTVPFRRYPDYIKLIGTAGLVPIVATCKKVPRVIPINVETFLPTTVATISVSASTTSFKNAPTITVETPSVPTIITEVYK